MQMLAITAKLFFIGSLYVRTRKLNQTYKIDSYRSSPSEVFLGKGVLKICSKFTGEHPCRSAISIQTCLEISS